MRLWGISILTNVKQLYWKETLTQVFSRVFCETLIFEAPIYYQANISLEKSLLARDLLLIYLIQLSQKHKSKKWFLFIYEFKINFFIIFNYLLIRRLS